METEAMVKNELGKITIEVIPDQGADTSYLEQDYAEVPSKAERLKYLKKDKARLKSLRRGGWGFVGIRATAEIYTIHPAGGPGGFDHPELGKVYKIVHRIKSAGLWGIESTSGRKYLREVAREELEALKGELEKLNVDTGYFDVAAEGELAAL